MGWELKMSKQDVDIKDMKVDGHVKIPLGSYIEELMIPNKKMHHNKLVQAKVDISGRYKDKKDSDWKNSSN